MRSLIALLCLSSIALAVDRPARKPAASDPRPTAEQVAAAVKRHREAKVSTKEGAIAALQSQLSSANAEKVRARSNGDRAALRTAGARIAALTREIKDAEKNWEPPPVSQMPLPGLLWADIKTGDVGRATQDAGNRRAYFYKCLQILENDSALIEVQVSDGQPMSVATVPVTTIKFTGLDTSKFQEGLLLLPEEMECDVVVVGRFRYRTAIGAHRTVFEVEVFDPDKPFK
jgi:hypothetical protein